MTLFTYENWYKLQHRCQIHYYDVNYALNYIIITYFRICYDQCVCVCMCVFHMNYLIDTLAFLYLKYIILNQRKRERTQFHQNILHFPNRQIIPLFALFIEFLAIKQTQLIVICNKDGYSLCPLVKYLRVFIFLYYFLNMSEYVLYYIIYYNILVTNITVCYSRIINFGCI